MEQVKFDPSKEGRLEGPYLSTSGWEQDHNGVHPVEMMARIATFQSKQEAQYEQYRKPFNRKGKSEYNKIVVCTYDGLEAFGNGKLEKQAKLVSARNMICKLKQFNIGIVNETIAAGVKSDFNPHKKPLVQQFKMFKSAGTLASSFVKASTDSNSSSSITTPPPPPVEDKEVDQYKAYIEGKISDPGDSLPTESEIKETKSAATKPQIVFKRTNSDQNSIEESESCSKKIKNDSCDDASQEVGSDWNPGNYGYANNYYGHNWRGRGRGMFQRGGWRGGGGYSHGYWS